MTQVTRATTSATSSGLTLLSADVAVQAALWHPASAEPLDYGEWMLSRGLSVNTIKQRLKFANRRMSEWGTLVLPPQALAAWLSQFSGWTLTTYTHHLRSIYAWLVDTDRLSSSPLEHYHRPGQPRRRHPKPLSDDELARVLDAALTTWNPEGGLASDHLYTWLQLGNLAGLRSHEMAKVIGRDFTDQHVHVLGKGGVDAWVPAHPHLLEIARRYPHDDYWFPSRFSDVVHFSSSGISNTTRELFRALGITFGSIHRLRHTFGTRLARNGVSSWALRDLMRHASVETSECYIEIAKDEHRAGILTLSIGTTGSAQPTSVGRPQDPAAIVAALGVGTSTAA